MTYTPRYVTISPLNIIPQYLLSITLDPFIFYYGGYRYNQPNHLYYVFILSHSFAYFIFDTIIEIFYRTDDALTNVHHAVCLAVSYFGIRAPHSAFEFVGKPKI